MISQYSTHFYFAALGLLMGIVMTISGFSDFTQIHKMFVFEDFRLLFGFAGAVILSMLGFMVFGSSTKTAKKKYNSGTIPGGILFGVGWAITGACPTIVLVQIGQGQFIALITLLGVFTGVWGYRRFTSGSVTLDTGICGEE